MDSGGAWLDAEVDSRRPLEVNTMLARRVIFLLVCSAVFAVGIAPAGSARDGSCAAAPRTFNSATAQKTFDDYIEDTDGPDICGQNRVTNDNEGWITFGMHIHNRSGFVGTEAYGVFLDTDLNPTTGGAGAEYRIRFTSEATVLGKWDGVKFPALLTLQPATWMPGYGPIFRVNASDLGGAKEFGLIFFSTDGVNGDLAPNRGAWSYQLGQLELGVRGLSIDRARAGRPFSARMTVMRSDLNTALTEGTITCSAKLGRKAVAGSGSFVGNTAVCTWRLPRSARGKRLTGAVAVTFQGAEAKRSFATKVR
jgi:hypothetical protein